MADGWAFGVISSTRLLERHDGIVSVIGHFFVNFVFVLNER